MKQEYSYTDCYKILSATSTHSFSEIRKAYKRKIQKYHPDKLDDNQKEAASNKIKELNAAFSQIEKYYNSHNSLPAIEPTDKPKERIKPANKQSKSEPIFDSVQSTNSPTSQFVPKNKSRKRRIAFIISICIASFVIFYIENFYIDIQPASLSEPVEPEKNKHPPSQVKTKSQISENTVSARRKIPEFFTIGSPIGEVIDVQGKPDTMDNNIWHYGKSKIFFKDGYVIDWKREKGHPIKARLIINEDLELKKSDINIKKNLPGSLPKQNNLNSLK